MIFDKLGHFFMVFFDKVSIEGIFSYFLNNFLWLVYKKLKNKKMVDFAYIGKNIFSMAKIALIIKYQK